MTKDEAKEAYGLVGLFCILYKEKYKKVPIVNKYREKWAMKDVIDSVGYDRAKKLLEQYFKLNKSEHSLTWFFYNFDKIDSALIESEKDKARREFIMKQTELMVKERDNEY